MRTSIPVTWCACAVLLNTTLVLDFLRSMSPVCERAWMQKAPILERYQRHLFYYRKADGEPLSTRSQHTRIIPSGTGSDGS